jgi:hypothetical protein
MVSRSGGLVRVFFMTMAIQLLNQTVSEVPSNRSVYRWEDLRAAIEAVAASDSLGWEAERVLLRVVRFEGELRLSEESELPHSMSPEEMLKSVAIQTLVRRTGLTHLRELQRVEATAASPVLASIVRATILTVSPPKMPASELEVIAEVRPSPRQEVVIWALGRSTGQMPANALSQGRRKVTGSRAVIHDHYTRYDVDWTPLQKNIVNKTVIFEHGLTFIQGCRRRIKRTQEELVIA